MIDWNKLLGYLYASANKLSETFLSLFNLAITRRYLSALVFLNLLNWFLAYYVNRNVSQSLVILHYNINLGVNLVGSVREIYAIPWLGLSFILINLLLLVNIYRQNKFFVHVLLGFTLLINLFLIIGTIAIYLVNFR